MYAKAKHVLGAGCLVFVSAAHAWAMGAARSTTAAISPALGASMQKVLVSGNHLKLGPNSVMAIGDRIETDSKGNAYIVTGHDGIRRPTVPLARVMMTVLPPPGSIPPLGPPSSWPPVPERRMLDEEGLITPVKDQQSRGTCSAFASVGALEAEYLIQYKMRVSLSEEYHILRWPLLARPPDPMVGGEFGEMAHYGLPLEKDYPYHATDSDLEALIRKAVPSSPAVDGDIFWNFFTNRQLQADIGNNNSFLFPPISVHESALYAPTAWASVSASAQDPSELEAVLAAGHPVTFGVSIDAWQQDPNTKIFSTDTGGRKDGHAMLLVGYDRVKRIFRFKNSWGAGWNGNGFGDVSYDLFLNTAGGFSYITRLRPLDNYGDPQVSGWGSPPSGPVVNADVGVVV